MKLLITGPNGFVGKNLVNTICKLNIEYKLTVLSRRTDQKLDSNIMQLIGQEGDNFFNTPIPDQLDVIIHLAGRAHILNDQSQEPITEFRQVNVEGTLQLARQAKEKKVKRFIFISSIGVNGAVTQEQPFSEDSIVQPHADYAISKLEAEQALQILFKDSETELVIIRPPLIYAAHAPGNFARLLKLVSTNLPLPFARTQNKRSFIALENLVDFIIKCIEHPSAANQIFLIADNESLSIREIVEYLKEGMNKTPCFIYIPQPFIKLGAMCIGKSKLYDQLFESLEVDATKARNLLNWRAPMTARQAMLQTGKEYLRLQGH